MIVTKVEVLPARGLRGFTGPDAVEIGQVLGVDPFSTDMGPAPSPVFTDNKTAKEWFGEAAAAIEPLQMAVNWVTPEMFPGANVTEKWEAALAWLAASGGGELRPKATTYELIREQKIPSNVTVRGAGQWLTIVKGAASMPLADNVLTNSLNDRLARTTYNENIHILDMTVDGNWQERDPDTGSTLNQASCIKLSTTRNFSIRRVRAINGILHCIDVMASVYWDDGDPTSQPPGPSLNFVIEDCIAENSRRDDAITTHNSGHGKVLRCRALFNEALYTPNDNQQGFEADEGSYSISFEDCYAKGWMKGYQAKGHSTTRPAIDIGFTGCIAENCAMSFEVAHTTSSIGRNVTLRDCTSRNVIAKGSTNAAAMNLKDYANILVDGFTIEGNSPDIAIRISNPTANIRLRNITFKDGSSLTGDSVGLIHLYASVGASVVTIEKVVCETPIACPVIRFSSSSTIKRVRDITATGTNNTIGCVYMQRNINDEVRVIRQTGYGGDVYESGDAMLLNNSVEISRGWRVQLRGNVAPEGAISAPAGAEYVNFSSINFYLKTGTGPTGWKLVTRAA